MCDRCRISNLAEIHDILVCGQQLNKALWKVFDWEPNSKVQEQHATTWSITHPNGFVGVDEKHHRRQTPGLDPVTMFSMIWPSWKSIWNRSIQLNASINQRQKLVISWFILDTSFGFGKSKHCCAWCGLAASDYCGKKKLKECLQSISSFLNDSLGFETKVWRHCSW